MEERAKERVFGVVILVAMAVIFIPMCFNKTVGDSVKLAREMPKPPEWPQSEELLLPTERLMPITAAEVTEFVPAEPATSSTPTAVVPAETVAAVAAPVIPVADPVVAVSTAPAPAVSEPVVAVSTPTAVVVAPKVSVAVAPVAKVVKAAPKTVQKKAPTSQKTAPVVQKTTKPLMAYTIQLGNFENQANAQKLARSLRAAGYTAYVADNYSHGKDLTKVMVGPHAQRKEAEKVASKLENQFKIKGFIVKYDPRN